MLLSKCPLSLPAHIISLQQTLTLSIALNPTTNTITLQTTINDLNIHPRCITDQSQSGKVDAARTLTSNTTSITTKTRSHSYAQQPQLDHQESCSTLPESYFVKMKK